jgi:hypothetical protein
LSSRLPVSFSCLSQRRMLFSCCGFSLNTRRYYVALESQIQILQATKQAAVSFELSPSCVNHSASERHLGHVARAIAFPSSLPPHHYPQYHLFLSNNVTIWNPTMTFGTHFMLWWNNALLDNGLLKHVSGTTSWNSPLLSNAR